jgi:hypothetical protein
MSVMVDGVELSPELSVELSVLVRGRTPAPGVGGMQARTGKRRSHDDR